jgi:hypothetical protein
MLAEHLTGRFAWPFVHRIGSKLLAVRLATHMANVDALDTWREQHKCGNGLTHRHGCCAESIDKSLRDILRMDGESRAGIRVLYLYSTAQLSGWRISGFDRLSIATIRQSTLHRSFYDLTKSDRFEISTDGGETRSYHDGALII